MHDLVVFSHLRWDFAYQRPQLMLSRLAKDRRVFFVEEPEYAAGPVCMRVSSPCPGVTVLRARTPVDAAGFADAQLAVLEPLLRRSLSDRDVRQAVAWFYTPMALPLLKAVHAPRAVVYDCLDDLSASDFASPQRLQREAELLDRADLVLKGGASPARGYRSAAARPSGFELREQQVVLQVDMGDQIV